MSLNRARPGGDAPPVRRLSLVGAILWITIGVMLPVLLSSAVAIVSLALGGGSNNIVIGVLILSFTATALGCGLVATLLIGNRQRLARQQADLATNVSHEIRTPLTTIQMYAQLLLSGKMEDQPAERQEAYQTILREVRWLDSTVDVLLAWRAAERNVDGLNLSRDPIDETVHLAVERFKQMVELSATTLTVEGETGAIVDHDRNAMISAVTNLLTNAHKYSSSNRHIVVALRREGATVHIAVRDDGIGISPGDLRRIFEPFFRADSRLSSKASGIGLGLTIVQRIVAGHGRKILAESTLGKGSCFTIVLPVAPPSRQSPGELSP